MLVKKTNIEGLLEISSVVHNDARGFFREGYKKSTISQFSHENFFLNQANFSRSVKNVIRGIHFNVKPGGQAKIVTCTGGMIRDFVVDLRKQSATLGHFQEFLLSESNGKSIYIPEGLGHAFLTLSDNADVTYLVTSEYDSEYEKVINPFDFSININWGDGPFFLSDKDQYAESLIEYLSVIN